MTGGEAAYALLPAPQPLEAQPQLHQHALLMLDPGVDWACGQHQASWNKLQRMRNTVESHDIQIYHYPKARVR